MDFTYNSYKLLLQSLHDNGYKFCTYNNYPREGKCVIMRHDIDYSLEQAIKLARFENEFGIKTTYFVLLSSDFYNPASSSSYKYLHEIIALGHFIGLHFDETAYSYSDFPIEFYIRKEARVLSEILDININSFSLHRPDHHTIETELKIPGLVNAYGDVFFREFKYLSDSRRKWREPVEELVNSKRYMRMHILTHAFWYHDKEQSIEETISEFISFAEKDRTRFLKDNIFDLESILSNETKI